MQSRLPFNQLKVPTTKITANTNFCSALETIGGAAAAIDEQKLKESKWHHLQKESIGVGGKGINLTHYFQKAIEGITTTITKKYRFIKLR